MTMNKSNAQQAQLMRASFEAKLSQRIERASRVRLQQFIPSHWFAAAASECAVMYVDGLFYGAISISQAYVEALSRYLSEHHHLRVLKSVDERCQRLYDQNIISTPTRDAALAVFSDRNDFHHLNRAIMQDFVKLEARALACVNHLHTIESDVFGFSVVEDGKVALKNPKYWPSDSDGLVQVNLRQL
jgi:hypothetical protein